MKMTNPRLLSGIILLLSSVILILGELVSAEELTSEQGVAQGELERHARVTDQVNQILSEERPRRLFQDPPSGSLEETRQWAQDQIHRVCVRDAIKKYPHADFNEITLGCQQRAREITEFHFDSE